MLLNETADPIELPGPESGIRSKRQGLQLELTCGFIPLHVNMHRLHTIEAVKRRSDMDREYPELMAIAPPLWVCQISDVSGDLGPGKSPYTGCGNDSEGEGARPVETLQGGRHGPENVEGPSRREDQAVEGQCRRMSVARCTTTLVQELIQSERAPAIASRHPARGM
jgi:hypothetical protein